MTIPVDQVTVWLSGDGWRWTRRAANGKIIAVSGEGHVDRSHATEMAVRCNPGVTVENGPPPGPVSPDDAATRLAAAVDAFLDHDGDDGGHDEEQLRAAFKTWMLS